MDFTDPPAVEELCRRVRRFVDEEVIPLEASPEPEHGLPGELLAELRGKARQVGVWAPQLPAEYGGLGLSLAELVPVFEEAGRSPLGPLALNCAAPDEGNMHLLHLAGPQAHTAKYLAPLPRGSCRLC